MIISIHIPKNAGVSFYSTLKDIYKNRLQIDYQDKIGSIEYLRRNFEKYPKIKNYTTIIHGHFQAEKYLKKYPHAQFITWFRDPVERIVSLYYFWKRKPDYKNSTCVKMLEKKFSLLEFASMPEVRDMQPYLIKPLNLTDFKFFGIVEHYYMSMFLFKSSMGIRKLNIHYENVNPNKKNEMYNTSREERKRIRNLNREGARLYQKAKLLFYARFLFAVLNRLIV
ncbi:MAG: Sulfotransferase family [Candidatus Woesebacteria bacterium GW2011_GWA2_40_7b]|uniref:Sulfotransferase family n=1 Tax=Candidatus Woesebacteria bacterium GW2011_GWA2_40_7b TaxID=1618563 RepID=A0A0G0W586_9BACT|nr:MAG: Sulfotransferase family [Candidatus Woesebacteria bacterium GW2011_GWA2_40_7b]